MKLMNLLRLTPYALRLSVYADLTIVQEVTSNNPMAGNNSQEMTVMVSKGRTRIEHSQGGMIMIPGENKNIVLMHPQRTYMLMPQPGPMMEGMPQQQGGVGSPASAPDQIKWEKTGKKETIAGYEAEQWIGKGAAGATTAEIWAGGNPEIIAEYIDSLAKSGQSSMAKLVEQMKAGMSDGPYKHGFPLKSVMYDENGAIQTTTLVKKLDNSGVDPKWFAVPDGYSEMKMPSMGQGGMPSPGGSLPADMGE